MPSFRRILDSIRGSWSGLSSGYRAFALLLVVSLAVVVTWAATSARPAPNRIADLAPAPTAGPLTDDAILKQSIEPSIFGSRQELDRRWLVATQQRLAGMIGRLSPVQSAAVQITPESENRSFGFKGGTAASAAVFLELRTGATLTRRHVDGICTMIAASWPGLKPAAVTVMDQTLKWYRAGEVEPTETTRDIEEKALKVLPAGAQVVATIRTTDVPDVAGPVPTPPVESKTEISVAVVIPFEEGAAFLPADDAGRARFVRETTSVVRSAVGATEVAVQLLPMRKPIVAAAIVDRAEPWWWRHAGAAMLLALGAAAVLVMQRLLKGMSVPSDRVTSEESEAPRPLRSLTQEAVEAATIAAAAAEKEVA